MDIITMYPPQKDSPKTFLINAIDTYTENIEVANAYIFNSLPLPIVLTIGIDTNYTEEVIVNTIDLLNNILIVTRGYPAYEWPAASQIARVLNASDLSAVQNNLTNVIDQSNGNVESIENIQEDIVNLDSAKIDRTELPSISVNFEFSSDGGNLNAIINYYNANTKETTSVTQQIPLATNTTAGLFSPENLQTLSNLETNKVDKSALTSVLTDWSQPNQNETDMTVTITRYNAYTQSTDTFTRTIPLVSSDFVGLMTPEAYTEISDLRADVTALQQQGGHFIGVSFATKADLDAYVIPETVSVGDFTYVIDDETHDDATTRYVYDGEIFDFAYVINYDPITIASTTNAGIVKSSSAQSSNNGKIFVETDGTMSLIGWDSLLSNITTNTYGISNTGSYISEITSTSTNTGSTTPGATGSAGDFTPAGSNSGTSLTSESTTPGSTGSTTPGATGSAGGFTPAGSNSSVSLTSNSTTPGATGSPSSTTTVVTGSLSGTTLTLSTASVGSSSHTHTSAAHTHTIDSHTHTFTGTAVAAHTHTSAAHTHTSASHTHTIASHTHTFTGTAVAAHTHTSAAHTHTYNNITGTSTSFIKQTVVTGVS